MINPIVQKKFLEWLQDGEITDFPDKVQAIAKINNFFQERLENLDLSDLHLFSLPQGLEDCEINILNLSCSEVKEGRTFDQLAENINNLQEVQQILLHPNQIKCWPEKHKTTLLDKTYIQENDISVPLKLWLALDAWKKDKEATGNKETACERIYQALHEEKEELDLSHLDLNSLPKEISYHLKNLSYLFLNDNQFECFPNISDFNNLHLLDISRNPLSIESLDQSLKQYCNIFAKLKVLQLEKVGLRELPKTINNCYDLVQLDLNDNPLEDLPQLSLKNLQFLDISNSPLIHLKKNPNRLLEIVGFLRADIKIIESTPHNLKEAFENSLQEWLNDPSVIGLKEKAAQSIKEAFVYRKTHLTLMGINSLPNCVNWLKINKLILNNIEEELIDFDHQKLFLPSTLAELEISNLILNQIPEVIENLRYLTKLALINTQFRILPETIDILTNLIALNLSHNELQTLPETVGNLRNLTSLVLSKNRLEELPESIGNLISLTELDLCNTGLQTLPETVGNLRNLTLLVLSENGLEELPESIGNLINLTNLVVHSNKLKTIPEGIGNLTDLTELDLFGNELTALPEVIGRLENLTSLHLGSNQLKTIPITIGNLINLTKLDVCNNGLKTLPKSIGNLINLTGLTLENNELENIPEAIGKLIKLTELDLLNNKLKTLPEKIGNLISLTKLRLNKNQLLTLPEAIGNLTNLRRLYVSNNSIQILPNSLENLINLRFLNLRKNKLSTLPNLAKSVRYLNISFQEIPANFELPCSCNPLIIKIKFKQDKQGKGYSYGYYKEISSDSLKIFHEGTEISPNWEEEVALKSRINKVKGALQEEKKFSELKKRDSETQKEEPPKKRIKQIKV